MIRNSGTGEKNPDVDQWPAEEFPDNLTFFGAAIRALEDRGVGNGGYLTIGFVGQQDLPGVMLRRAQSSLRWDLRPSLWSHTFVVTAALGDGEPGELPLSEVSLHSRTGAFPDPAYNSVVTGKLGSYGNAELDGNVGLLGIQMTDEQVEEVGNRARFDFNQDRQRYSLWETLGIWQSYFWSAGAAPNPLREGVPMFSSAFIEYCFEAIYLDLSPGASERNSAPEHLWNAALWWHEGFANLGHRMAGFYVVRDPGCAVADASEAGPPGER